MEAAFKKLIEDNFKGRLLALYGLNKDEAQKKDPYFTQIGFDGASNRLGWSAANLEWIAAHQDKVEKVLNDAEYIRNHFKHVIFCGMGGSGLSVQAVKTIFGERQVKIYGLRTTDPAAIKDILNEITLAEQGLNAALRKTLVIAVSKSGKTEETASHKKYFENLYKKEGIDIKKHMWVITDKGSPIDTGIYPQREIQLNGLSDIGGRFTAPTTLVFLLPLALVAPKKVLPMLQNAREMSQEDSCFLKLAAYLYMSASQGKDKITILAPEELHDMLLWAEQIFEESLGKDGKGVTLFYGEKIETAELKPKEENDRVFVRINLSGRKTRQDLWDLLIAKGYPVFEIEIKDIDCVGSLMLGFEMTVAAVGYLWSICFVDQPAVESYKKAAREVMAKLSPGETVQVPLGWKSSGAGGLKLYYEPLIQAGILSTEELETEVKKIGVKMDDAAVVYAAILSILRKRPDYQAQEFASYGRMTDEFKATLENARYTIFTRGFKMPSKLGEGPDKNHSYHQNVEAGKDIFFSTYFLPLKAEEPPALAFGGNLIKAQAIGTVQSLIEKKRKVVLITFDGNISDSVKIAADFFRDVIKYLTIK